MDEPREIPSQLGKYLVNAGLITADRFWELRAHDGFIPALLYREHPEGCLAFNTLRKLQGRTPYEFDAYERAGVL